MKKSKLFVILFYLLSLSLAYSLNYSKTFIEVIKNDESAKICFYLSNSSCLINFKPLNLSYNLKSCEGKITINNLTQDINVFFILKNGSVFEKTIKKPFYYKILKRDIFISDEANLYIKVYQKGYLKLCNFVVPLKEGQNKIDLLSYFKENNCYPFGNQKIILEFCNNNGCKKFEDYLYFEKSPISCKIDVKNNFPYYLAFNFSIYDQKGNVYVPKNVYFDMDILPVKNGKNFYVNFSEFYKAGTFLIKFLADGKTCYKAVNLSYDKFFYAYSSPFERKINITNLVLENPYKGNYTLEIKYLNKSLKVNLSNEITLKLPFTNFELVYNNKTFYVVKPKVIKSNVLSKLKEKILKFIIVVFVLIGVFNLFILLLSRKERN